MAKYLVTGGVISTPGKAFYQGEEVTAEDLAIPQQRIAHLLTLGALEDAAETPVVAPPPPPPADPLATAVGVDTAAALRAAGLGSPEAITGASDADLLKVDGLTDAKLKKLRALK